MIAIMAAGMLAAAGFRAPAVAPTEHESGFLWLEAESFSDYGAWRLDTQFTHKMGSAYLIAPGADKPIGSAKTTLTVPRAGTWHAWVRTKDWLPEFSPGRFALTVNGRQSGPLGASKREGWRWEKAGAFELPQGDVFVSLDDLSGAFARCDAILFTTDAAYVPPDDADGVAAARARFAGETDVVNDGGAYDVVVVGAGPGGMGASLGAARNGARVALVFDRPVPGGNASEECGIGFDGASLGKKNARETGVVEEIRLTKVYRGKSYTAAFEEMARKSPGLALFRNERVMRVEKDGARITAVVSRNTTTGRWTRWRGRIFVDSTGDGWIGHFAGARTMYGREAGSEYGEEWIAPKVADRLTMSGTLTTGLSRRTDREEPYETPVWARVMPKGFDRKVPGLGRPWWLEAPGRIDDLEDPEAARDHLIRICFGYWGYVRNEWPDGPARGHAHRGRLRAHGERLPGRADVPRPRDVRRLVARHARPPWHGQPSWRRLVAPAHGRADLLGAVQVALFCRRPEPAHRIALPEHDAHRARLDARAGHADGGGTGRRHGGGALHPIWGDAARTGADAHRRAPAAAP